MMKRYLSAFILSMSLFMCNVSFADVLTTGVGYGGGKTAVQYETMAYQETGQKVTDNCIPCNMLSTSISNYTEPYKKAVYRRPLYNGFVTGVIVTTYPGRYQHAGVTAA